MNTEKEQKNKNNDVISPLANEKTYGERMYSRVFDWGLNYWTNLLASAGFSHWAANSTKEIKVFGFEKAAPRVLQEKLGEWISGRWFMQGYKERQIAKHGVDEGMKYLSKRGFAMAESLTLLVPGFAVMIPSVWLGAKIKPAIVEWFNKRHYGDDALDDPSLKARHEALRAESRPTLFGTVLARIGTVFAVQLSAKLIGSESNTVNWVGEKTNVAAFKNFKGINPAAEALGGGIGSSFPQSLKTRMNQFAERKGFTWSNKQAAAGMSGPYDQAAQDLTKYIAMDTMYTMVSAGTIHPMLRLIKHIPVIGQWMSYQPKTAANSPTLDGDKVKVPANRYADAAPDASAPAANDAVILDAAKASTPIAANDEKIPDSKVTKIHAREMLAEKPHKTVGVDA